MKLKKEDFAVFDARATEGRAVARAIDGGRIIPSRRSRNQREGVYVGHSEGKAVRAHAPVTVESHGTYPVPGAGPTWYELKRRSER